MRRDGDPAPVEALRESVFRDGLAFLLRDATHAWHIRAERSGIVRDMLRRRIDRHAYALWLRNLFPVYARLEQSLARLRDEPVVGWFAQPTLFRVAALEADMTGLDGPDWSSRLALLPASRAYAERIAVVAQGDGIRLIAHAYVRYLGDLSGGRILRRLLARTPGLDEATLNFYTFPDIPDPEAFKGDYRDALDRAGRELAESPELIQSLLDEAVRAFEHNIAVSEAVRSVVSGTD